MIVVEPDHVKLIHNIDNNLIVKYTDDPTMRTLRIHFNIIMQLMHKERIQSFSIDFFPNYLN